MVVTVSSWSPASLAALLLSSLVLNHMCVGEQKAGCGHHCLTVGIVD